VSQQQTARVTRCYVQKLDAPPEKVFPLLCPTREYEWIEPWQCDLLYSRSGVAELHCVFTTGATGDPSEEVWVISRYEPSRIIEFVRVNAVRVLCYSIVLDDNGDGTTSARNTQTLTALRGCVLEEGEDEQFLQEMRIGEILLNHYLSTGRRLPFGEAMAKVAAGTNSRC